MIAIILQAATGTSALMGNLVLIGGIIVIFYFFMIRPQQKKQKDQRKFLEELKKGDSVVTLGGAHGKVVAIEGDTVQVEVDKGVRIIFEKSAISLEASKKYAEKKS